MGIPTNYIELQAELAAWLKRNDQVANIPLFIDLGEADINAISRLKDQEKTAAITTISGQNYSDIPTGFLEDISIKYTDGVHAAPTKVTIDNLDNNSNEISSGVPSYYAISDSKIYWNIKPDSAYNLTIRYWKKWDIATDSTNWLLTNFPGAYIYSSLVHGGNFTRNDKMFSSWKTESRSILDKIEYLSSQQRRASLRVDHALSKKGSKFNIKSGS